MICVIQRVLEASVAIENDQHSIGHGLLILAGIEKGDNRKDIEYSARKIVSLRMFPDASGKMNLSVKENNGQLLAVSQFTLAGTVTKGRRPSFDRAMSPLDAEPLFNAFTRLLSELRGQPVLTGFFGEHMTVSLVNDGPVTFITDSKKRFS